MHMPQIYILIKSLHDHCREICHAFVHVNGHKCAVRLHLECACKRTRANYRSYCVGVLMFEVPPESALVTLACTRDFVLGKEYVVWASRNMGFKDACAFKLYNAGAKHQALGSALCCTFVRYSHRCFVVVAWSCVNTSVAERGERERTINQDDIVVGREVPFCGNRASGEIVLPDTIILQFSVICIFNSSNHPAQNGSPSREALRPGQFCICMTSCRRRRRGHGPVRSATRHTRAALERQ